jgi:hypothetical protein
VQSWASLQQECLSYQKSRNVTESAVVYFPSIKHFLSEFEECDRESAVVGYFPSIMHFLSEFDECDRECSGLLYNRNAFLIRIRGMQQRVQWASLQQECLSYQKSRNVTESAVVYFPSIMHFLLEFEGCNIECSGLLSINKAFLIRNRGM